MSDLVPIYSAANLIQAKLLRDALEEEGIDAWVINEALAGGVGELPAGWSSSPRVVVARENAEAARQLALAFERRAPQLAIGADQDSQVVDAEPWPRCVMCGQRRLAVCKYCGHAGVDFAIGYQGPSSAIGGALQVVCPTCDEPFRPRFYKLCEHCGYEFDDGVELPRPTRSVEEVGADLTRVWVVIGGMLLLFVGIAGYFAWIMR